MTRSSTNAPAKPSAGETRAGNATLWTTPCHSTPFDPDWTSAAPIRPPISACDELEGRPRHHVSRFHAIAPSSAASTVFSVARPVSMIPLPTVVATAVVTKAPARFATAATELDQLRLRVLEALQPLDRGVEVPRRLVYHPRLLDRLLGNALDAIGAEVVRRFVDVIADIVDRTRKPVHVVAVERRHEGPVEQIDHLVGELVALVLALLDLRDQAAVLGREPVQQLDEKT